MIHPSAVGVLKKEFIDEALIPVVRWINEFKYAFTMSCCQGGYGLDGRAKPYIIYAVWIDANKKRIEEILSPFGSITPTNHMKPYSFMFEVDEHRLHSLINKISKKAVTHQVWIFFKEDNMHRPFPWSIEGTEKECRKEIKEHQERGKSYGWTLVHSDIRTL